MHLTFPSTFNFPHTENAKTLQQKPCNKVLILENYQAILLNSYIVKALKCISSSKTATIILRKFLDEIGILHYC